MVSGSTASSMNTPIETVWLHVDGIVCYACVGLIESLASGVPGVCAAAASYVSEGIRLECSDPEAPDAVCRVLASHGYPARKTGLREAMETDRQELRRLRLRILISFALSIFLVPYPFLKLPPFLLLALATAVQVIAGRSFYREALTALAAHSANMSVLVSIGTLAAYLYSAVSVLRGSGELFFEASGTVLVLVMLGKYLERSARVSSGETIRALLHSGPGQANLLTDAGETQIPAARLRAGDRFVVHRGEWFPTDGIVLSGVSRADESSLTGESGPVSKAKGDRVLGGTVNLDDRLTLQAERDHDDSVFASMCRALLQGVSGEKARVQKLADRVCSRFIPAVLLIALATLLLWYGFLAPGDLATALIRSVGVLIVACPCAMGIAAPLAMTTAIGALGRSGIFVKSPSAIEKLAETDLVVLDKTGTLTVPAEGGGERLRAGAKPTIETLQAMGIEVWLLTGDRQDAALRIAAEAGIPAARVRSALLPEDKLALLRQLQQSHTVCMAGDGINDALSLQQADVGIAIGRAAELTVACADLVVTRNRITHLLKALYAGRVTLRNIRRSLFWAVIYNVIGIALCAAGIVTPVIAGAAMSLSSLSVVLNARALEGRFQKMSFAKISAAPPALRKRPRRAAS